MMPVGVITLTLPWPLSANRYWQPVHVPAKRGTGGKGHISIVPTKEAKAFRIDIAWRARAAGVRQPLAGPIEVTLQLFPHLPQDWAKRAKDDPVWWDLTVQTIDLDNAQKVLWDSLKDVAFTDDRMIRKSQCEIAVPDGEARVVVTIKPYEREHPQAGLFAREPVYVPKPKVEKRSVKREPAPVVAELPPGVNPF